MFSSATCSTDLLSLDADFLFLRLYCWKVSTCDKVWITTSCLLHGGFIEICYVREHYYEIVRCYYLATMKSLIVLQASLYHESRFIITVISVNWRNIVLYMVCCLKKYLDQLPCVALPPCAALCAPHRSLRYKKHAFTSYITYSKFSRVIMNTTPHLSSHSTFLIDEFKRLPY